MDKFDATITNIFNYAVDVFGELKWKAKIRVG
jgi:hypothetical protein